MMPKTVTLRLNDNIYNLFRNLAESENRPLSNFIETSVLRFIENSQFVDEFEMAEIQSNQDLNRSLKRALKDVKAQRGRFVE
jgi:predicted transcriptional regulator